MLRVLVLRVVFGNRRRGGGRGGDFFEDVWVIGIRLFFVNSMR